MLTLLLCGDGKLSEVENTLPKPPILHEEMATLTVKDDRHFDVQSFVLMIHTCNWQMSEVWLGCSLDPIHHKH